jgi:BCD family chlorophyll transporter-like MFS transporter
VQHGGVLLGMVIVALAGSGVLGRIALRMGWRRSATLVSKAASLRAWTAGGCLASALALVGLVAASMSPGSWPLKTTVFLLGAANGAFSIAAIGSMMALASEGREASEGVRLGLWGAAQAVAFGLGGIVGTGSSDLATWLIGTPSAAYATVFAFEALLFVIAAGLALWTALPARRATPVPSPEPAVLADRSRVLPAHRVMVRQPRSATSPSPL